VTVHIISVGLSLLTALKEPGRTIPSDERLRQAVLDAKPHRLLADAGIGNLASDRGQASAWIAVAIADADSAQGKKLRDVADAARPKDWPRRMSAELDTFSRLSGSRSFVLGRKDIAVLVCSDTADGLLAGAWNAIAIAGGDIRRVRYVPDLDDRPFGAESKKSLRSSVVIARVVGLDAGDEGFRGAMRGLGLLAGRLFASGVLDPGEDFQFILSGGYKASIPYLIGLAETIRSVDDDCLRDLGVPGLTPAPEPYPVTAWVQHETADPDAPPIRLPLRRLVAEAARQEVSDYDEHGIRTRPLGATLLEGYAYDVKKKFGGKKQYVLTPFGEGLRAFLGATHARPGG
jgi:hypothetical protein